MRLRYADLAHQATSTTTEGLVDPAGPATDFGTGQDLPEFMEAVRSEDGLLREVGLEDADVTYPRSATSPRGHGPRSVHGPSRGLPHAAGVQEDQHRRGQGLVYGWHFYQAGDATS